ncbi:MAG: M20/M25/M40 family metallo-hydrolase [Propionibacteriaceae bacterium]|jgi:acetylornithine deacetylase/succinyl-diaminopimelate desuccinylase-like protein|nr:M20/M25/M40 family metallo-hydrolase [Propionibacteriaceae bacterium]
MSPTTSALDEAIGFTCDLIRIDTSNYGPGKDGPGERVAAEYVAGKLDEVGIHADFFESQPRRTTLVASWEGVDTTLPPLLIHGHLDVVPAMKDDWSIDPFAGAIENGYVWGRGAIDMKNFDAILLAVVRQRIREGRPPRRNIRLVFTADEESGGPLGSVWMARNHPDAISDCTQAVGEVGGFSITANDKRIYLIQTAEKGIAWLDLIAEGTAGHGSMRNSDNPVSTLARAVADLSMYRWPVSIHPAQQAFLDTVSEALEVEITADNVEETLTRLGSIARMVGATMGNTLNPTMLDAGYKVNVIPGTATAGLDGRFLPGQRDEFLATVKSIIGDKVRMVAHEQPSAEAPWGTDLTDAMGQAVLEADPGALITPYILSAGTDAKGWGELGIASYGFVPLKLPADLDFVGMFHGVDERVPIESLEFAVGVYDRFLDLA